MKYSGSLLILFFASMISFGQQHKVILKVTPRNAEVSLDGKDLGDADRKKIRLGFNDRKGISEHEVVVTAQGYQDYKKVFDSAMPKKETLTVKLERDLPRFEPAPEFYIDIEKVVSGIEYSTEVGANTRWKFRYNEEIDLAQKKLKLIEVLSKMGLRTISGPSDDLFDTGNQKPRTADILIAGRVEGFTLKRGSDDSYSYYSTGYTSVIDINWQFYDRHKKEIIFKETISSEYYFESSLITEEFYNSVLENFYVLFNKGMNIEDLLTNYSSKRVDFSSSSSKNNQEVENSASEENDSLEVVEQTSVPKSDLFDDEILYDELVVVPYVQLEKMDVFSDLVAVARNASVTVIIDDRGHGSGVIVSSNGYIVTNHHVVDDAKYIDVQFANGIILPGDIIASSEKYDLALIKVRAGGLTALPIASDPEKVRQGDEVFVVGAPRFKELGQSVSKGIISGKRANDGVKIIQTDTKISPGNSGSPLINMNGEIVGIINSKFVDEGVEGLGFAIDSRYLYNVLGLKYE